MHGTVRMFTAIRPRHVLSIGKLITILPLWKEYFSIKYIRLLTFDLDESVIGKSVYLLSTLLVIDRSHLEFCMYQMFHLTYLLRLHTKVWTS